MSSAVVMKAAEGERTKFAAYRRQPTTYSDAQSRASGLRSSSSRVWPLGTKWATNCGDRGQALSGAVEVGAQLRGCPKLEASAPWGRFLLAIVLISGMATVSIILFVSNISTP
jgi:hypothetical protein